MVGVLPYLLGGHAPLPIRVATEVRVKAITATTTPPRVKDKSPFPADAPAASAPSKTTASFDGTGTDESLLSTNALATVPSATSTANDNDEHLISFDATFVKDKSPFPTNTAATAPPKTTASFDSVADESLLTTKAPTTVPSATCAANDYMYDPDGSKSPILAVPASKATTVDPSGVLADANADDKSLVLFTPTNMLTPLPSGAEPANAAGTCKAPVPFDRTNQQASPPSRPAPSTDEDFVDFDSHFILLDLEEGQCSAKAPDRPSTTVPATHQDCVDVHPGCISLAAAGECSNNPEELSRDCPQACGLCSRNESGKMNILKQVVAGSTDDMATIMELLYKGKLHADSWGPNCVNRHDMCGIFASFGECIEKGVEIDCAPVCGTCDKQSRHNMEKVCSQVVVWYQESDNRQACKDILALGPQRLDSKVQEAVYMHYDIFKRYNAPDFNVELSDHPYVVQIFKIESYTPDSLAVFRCSGTIDRLSTRNTLLIATSNHCAHALRIGPASSLRVQVLTEEAVQQDDGNVGCIARVSEVHGPPLILRELRAESDYATLELEKGQCVDSAKFAVDKWDGPGRVLDSLSKNLVPASVLNQHWYPNLDSPDDFKCRPGDYVGKLGTLYYPHPLNEISPDFKALHDTLSHCRQEDALHPTDDYETMFKIHLGYVRESGILKRKLQRIPLAVWHHPCPWGLLWAGGDSGWPFQAICATPLVGPYMDKDGIQNGDSGGGVFRYDPKTKKYTLVGVSSKASLLGTEPEAAGTNIITPFDTYADNRI